MPCSLNLSRNKASILKKIGNFSCFNEITKHNRTYSKVETSGNGPAPPSGLISGSKINGIDGNLVRKYSNVFASISASMLGYWL